MDMRDPEGAAVAAFLAAALMVLYIIGMVVGKLMEGWLEEAIAP